MGDYKIGTCKWCSNKGDVFSDNGMCDDCDSNTIICRVCRCQQHYDNACRHVFQDENFEWRGAGVYPTDEDMKLPLHRLLSAMGEEFTRDLKHALAAGEFYTFMVAPLIGGGGTLDLGGMPHQRQRQYGDRLIRLGQSDRAKTFSDGYHWLASLYKRNTTKANQATVAWIDQWLWPFTPSMQTGDR